MQIIHFRLMICCEVIRRQSIDGQVVELRMTRSRIKIVRRALEEPLRQIAANAGKEGAVVVENVAAKKTAAYGYNVATEELPSGNHVLSAVAAGALSRLGLRQPASRFANRHNVTRNIWELYT